MTNTYGTLVHSPLGAVGVLGLITTAYALLSAHSFFDVCWLLSLVACFVAGYRIDGWLGRRIWHFALLALLLNGILTLFDGWTGFSFGLFGNPNFFGIAMAIGLAGSLAYRYLLYAPIFGLSVIFSYSRTAYLAASATIVAALWRRHKGLAGLMLAIAVGAILATSSTENKLDSISQRIGIWADTLEHLSITGFGWGSFFDTYWSWPVHRLPALLRPAHVYNDYLEVIFNLGLGSILLWAFLAACLEGSDSMRRLVIIAFGAAALTHFPISIFPCAQLFALTLGQLRRGLR